MLFLWMCIGRDGEIWNRSKLYLDSVQTELQGIGLHCVCSKDFNGL